MLKKTVTYTDFNGVERIEDCYFNLTRAEALDFAFELPEFDSVNIDENDEKSKQQAALTLFDKLGSVGIYKFIKDLVAKSYGIKSTDGKRFEKNEQATKEFTQGLAYDSILMEFISDDIAAADFINAVIPTSEIKNLIK